MVVLWWFSYWGFGAVGWWISIHRDSGIMQGWLVLSVLYYLRLQSRRCSWMARNTARPWLPEFIHFPLESHISYSCFLCQFCDDCWRPLVKRSVPIGKYLSLCPGRRHGRRSGALWLFGNSWVLFDLLQSLVPLFWNRAGRLGGRARWNELERTKGRSRRRWARANPRSSETEMGSSETCFSDKEDVPSEG